MTRVTASATATAHQIPLMPNTIGSINTAASCITSVLRKDMVADTSPLPRPVKKPEPNTLNPQNRNDMEKASYRSGSYGIVYHHSQQIFLR